MILVDALHVKSVALVSCYFGASVFPSLSYGFLSVNIVLLKIIFRSAFIFQVIGLALLALLQKRSYPF